MSSHSQRAASAVLHAPHSKFALGRFRRLFSREAAPPWRPAGASESEQLDHVAALALGSFEAADDAPRFDNPSIPAGYTYFGQFIDHDITFEPLSTLQRANDVESLGNFRTPCFDLDSVYGRGPDDQPYLYETARRGRLLTATNERGEPDLARNGDASTDSASTDAFATRRRALIGDPRNDENIMVSQLQLAVIGLHNRFIDDGESFERAQQLTRWHYQWVVVHDFAKRLCGSNIVDSLLSGSVSKRFFAPRDRAWLPIEFVAAAYRLGHSMVRPSYHLNDTLEGFRGGRPLDIFGTAPPFTAGDDPREHLAGGRLLPNFWTIQWDRMVAHAGSVPQASRRLDQSIATPLMSLPFGGSVRERSLPFRNLQRGWRMDLPSGQTLANVMQINVPELSAGDDPLWLYILKEAQITANGGEHLGPLGGRIVAEVLVALLEADPSSFINASPGWRPASAAGGSVFDLASLLAMAGAPMTAAEANALMNA